MSKVRRFVYRCTVSGLAAMSVLACKPTKLVAPDARADDRFGFAVAVSGGYAIVGEYAGRGAGAAYVYRRTGRNSWDTGTKLVAPDAQAGGDFGGSVAISGGYAIVGEPGKNSDDPFSSSGVAHVFQRTGDNTWDTGTELVSHSHLPYGGFGRSVAADGNYAIVGAPGEGYGLGAAYVFRRTGDTWDAGTRLSAFDRNEYQYYGDSVAISGDYAIVGAYGDDGDGSLHLAGAAYVFRRTGDNTWDTGTKLVAPDAESYEGFGESVALSGDTAIVGVPGRAGGGAAYAFERTGLNSWDAGTKLVAPVAQPRYSFGHSVALSGEDAIVGAFTEDGGDGDPLLMAGVAYVFRRRGAGSWFPGVKLMAPDAQARDWFGYSVAISGCCTIVGATGEDGGDGDPLDGAGAAYAFCY